MRHNPPPFNTANTSGNKHPIGQRFVSDEPRNMPVGSATLVTMDKHGRVRSDQKLSKIRKLMGKDALDYYIIPGDDAHESGYIHNTTRMAWLSGFTGTAGQIIVSKTAAYLITDSRYSRQALRELDPNYDLFHHIQVGDVDGPKDWADWLVDRANGARIGIDARLLSCEAESQISKQLAVKSSEFCYPPQNFVDLAREEQLPTKKYPIFVHGNGGEIQAATKLDIFQSWITKKKHTAAIVTSLPSIAFLLNLCSTDSQLQSFPQSCFFISLQHRIFFTESEEVTGAVHHHLKSLGIERKPYNDLWQFLERKEWGDGKVLVSPQAPYDISLKLNRPFGCTVVPFINDNEIAKMESTRSQARGRLSRDGFVASSSNHSRGVNEQAPYVEFFTNAQGIDAQGAEFGFVGRDKYNLKDCVVRIYNQVRSSANDGDAGVSS